MSQRWMFEVLPAAENNSSFNSKVTPFLFEAPLIFEADAYTAQRHGNIIFKGGWKQYRSIDAAINAVGDSPPGIYKILERGTPVYVGEGKVRSELVAFRRHYQLAGKSLANVTVMVGNINRPTKKRLETVEQVLICTENKKLAQKGKKLLRNSTSTKPFRVPQGKTLTVKVPGQKSAKRYRPGLHESGELYRL
jgi:hypothetical protein